MDAATQPGVTEVPAAVSGTDGGCGLTTRVHSGASLCRVHSGADACIRETSTESPAGDQGDPAAVGKLAYRGTASVGHGDVAPSFVGLGRPLDRQRGQPAVLQLPTVAPHALVPSATRLTDLAAGSSRGAGFQIFPEIALPGQQRSLE